MLINCIYVRSDKSQTKRGHVQPWAELRLPFSCAHRRIESMPFHDAPGRVLLSASSHKPRAIRVVSVDHEGKSWKLSHLQLLKLPLRHGFAR